MKRSYLNQHYIGINQRLNIRLLEELLYSYWQEGMLNVEELNFQLGLLVTGINRKAKARQSIIQIFTRQRPILKFLRKKIPPDFFYGLSASDRKALLLALLALTYPIIYRAICIISPVFKVQPVIRKALLVERLSAIYGGNSAFFNAINAITPMLCELGVWERREKRGLYYFCAPLLVQNPYIAQLLIFTELKLSEYHLLLYEEIKKKYWFFIFQFTVPSPEIVKLYTTHTELQISSSKILKPVPYSAIG